MFTWCHNKSEENNEIVNDIDSKPCPHGLERINMEESMTCVESAELN